MSTTATTTTTTIVEDGGELPPPEELIPITQSLITPELAGAFSIPQDFFKNQAAQPSPDQQDEALDGGSRKVKKQQDADSEDSGNSGGDEPSARTHKRPRLVWTPQLHKRFVDAVAQLGIKSAVPKTIMQLMNVEGLTRENVASHLQKYRLYLKRMQGIPSEGPPSDPLFSSTPVPPGLASAAHFLQNHHEVVPLPFTMTHPYADPHHAFAMGRAVQPQQQQQQPRLPELKDQVVVDLGSIGQQRPGPAGPYTVLYTSSLLEIIVVGLASPEMKFSRKDMLMLDVNISTTNARLAESTPRWLCQRFSFLSLPSCQMQVLLLVLSPRQSLEPLSKRYCGSIGAGTFTCRIDIA